MDEALKHGIKEEEIVKNWREVFTSKELQDKIMSPGGFIWIVTDDTFVPDYWDIYDSEVKPLLNDNGDVTLTKGCVCPVIEFAPRERVKSTEFFRTPTATFCPRSKQVTSERRKNMYSYAQRYNYLGHGYNVSKKKRLAALALLNPASPTYGNLLTSYFVAFPNRIGHHKEWKQRRIALRFFNRPWFYRLIKADWLLSMLSNELKAELQKIDINYKFVAGKLKTAVDIAEEKKDVKELRGALGDIMQILQAEPNKKVPVKPQGLLSASTSTVELPPFIDQGEKSPDILKQEKEEGERRQQDALRKFGDALNVQEAVFTEDEDVTEFAEQQVFEEEKEAENK